MGRSDGGRVEGVVDLGEYGPGRAVPFVVCAGEHRPARGGGVAVGVAGAVRVIHVEEHERDPAAGLAERGPAGLVDAGAGRGEVALQVVGGVEDGAERCTDGLVQQLVVGDASAIELVLHLDPDHHQGVVGIAGRPACDGAEAAAEVAAGGEVVDDGDVEDGEACASMDVDFEGADAELAKLRIEGLVGVVVRGVEEDASLDVVAVVGAAHREFVDAEGVVERVGAGLDALATARAGAVCVGCGLGAVAAGGEERESEQGQEATQGIHSMMDGVAVVTRQRFVTVSSQIRSPRSVFVARLWGRR